MAAERIECTPPLLIFDEPAWGIAARFATALLQCVCLRTCDRKIPLLIISHNRYADYNFIKSRIRLNSTKLVHKDHVGRVTSEERGVSIELVGD